VIPYFYRRPYFSVASWLNATYRYLRFAALLLLAAFSPRIHDRASRHQTALVLCNAAWQPLPGYLLASILISIVVTRVIAVSANSYGLSHLALEAIVRVFVIEVLPLVSSLFIATRAVPMAMHHLVRLSKSPVPATVRDALPYAVGNSIAVVVLAVASGLVSLLVAYLVIHGFTQWGLPGYARLIGLVFDPILAIAFAAKIMLFGLAVGIAPVTIVLEPGKEDSSMREMRIMVRLLLVLIFIEVSFLLLQGF
jgi:phospholipid/cholesterol/gamma-HCH transport system permease protein